MNVRKTVLLAALCGATAWTGWTPQAFAASVSGVEAVQQAKKVTGTVVDAMGPVIGANVIEQGTTNGVITDIDGHFSLEVQPGSKLEISFIGYVTQVIEVGNQTDFNIT